MAKLKWYEKPQAGTFAVGEVVTYKRVHVRILSVRSEPYALALRGGGVGTAPDGSIPHYEVLEITREDGGGMPYGCYTQEDCPNGGWRVNCSELKKLP